MSSLHRRIRFLVSAAAVGVIACGGGGSTTPPPAPPPPPPTIASLTIQGLPATIEVGVQAQLSVVARNSAGTVVNNPALAWSSTAPAIATITPTAGRVTAVSAGQTTIRVAGGGTQAELPLTVTAPTPTAVALTPASVAIAPGALAQMQYSVIGANGVIPGLPVTFTTGNAAIATVSATGQVTAVGPGRTTITAHHGGLTQVSGVTVSTSTQNLRVARADMIQVAQTAAADVPLVQGKPSAIRIHAVAAQPGANNIPIDVRLERNGLTVFYTRVNSGQLRTTFNPLVDGAAIYVPVPSALDLNGVTLSTSIDPDDVHAESDEWDNDFPGFRDADLGITSLQLPQIQVRLVGMAPPGQTPPDVTFSQAQQLVSLMNSIYPSVGISVQPHGSLVTNAGWGSDNGVIAALNQLQAMRTADGSNAYYYGVTATTEINGAAGWGQLPGSVSMGWAMPEIVAHEVGHNFGLAHPTGCGNGTPGAPGAVIGLPGYDPRNESEVPSSAVSVMSYCPGYVWIQPTSYLTILNARKTASTLRADAVEASSAELAIMLTGSVNNGIASIDQVQTLHRPRGASSNAGPVRVRLLDGLGTEVMSWNLASTAVATEGSSPVRTRGFAGVVPVPAPLAARIRRIAVSTGGAETVRTFRLESLQ